MKLALAGDTMLGRKVAERLARVPPSALFSDGVVADVRHGPAVEVVAVLGSSEGFAEGRSTLG